MATLRLFAAAREAAGTGHAEFEGSTVSEVLDAAVAAYGAHFGVIVEKSKVWLNGEPADATSEVGIADEVAVLPPVSGGFR